MIPSKVLQMVTKEIIKSNTETQAAEKEEQIVEVPHIDFIFWGLTMETQGLHSDTTDFTIKASKGSTVHQHKILLSKEAMHQAYIQLEEKDCLEFSRCTHADDQPLDQKYVQWIFDPRGHLPNLRSSSL